MEQQIIHGDCLQVMKTLEDNSIDLKNGEEEQQELYRNRNLAGVR